MGNPVTVHDRPPQVAPGIYQAQLIAIESKHSEQYSSDFWVFTFDVGGDQEETQVDATVGDSFGLGRDGTGTRGRKMLQALLGRALVDGEEIDLDAQVGKSATIIVVEDDKGWAKVDTVAPPQAAKAQTAKATSKEEQLAAARALLAAEETPAEAPALPF